jgi:hypothetical protein
MENVHTDYWIWDSGKNKEALIAGEYVLVRK